MYFELFKACEKLHPCFLSFFKLPKIKIEDGYKILSQNLGRLEYFKIRFGEASQNHLLDIDRKPSFPDLNTTKILECYQKAKRHSFSSR